MQSRRASRKTRATPELFEVGKPETEIGLVANFRVPHYSPGMVDTRNIGKLFVTVSLCAILPSGYRQL